MTERVESFVKNRKKLFFCLIFLVSFIVTSIGINQTGETWDEIPYYNAAKQYASNIKHFRTKGEDWAANKEHPPVAKYVYMVASAFEMQKEGENYTGGRLASAAMISLTISLTFLFTLELFGALAGLLAAIVLLLTPPFIGFGRVLGMDSPTALAITLIGISFYKFANSKAMPKDYIIPALVFSLGIATRYNIVLSGLFLPVAVLLFSSWRFELKKWLSFFIFPIAAVLIFYLVWPFLWQDPIGGIDKSIGHWGQVKEWYFGVSNATLPNSYFLSYFFYVTPAVVLILSALGLIIKPWNNKKLYILALLLVPFINSVVGIKQGGVRYLLFVFVPLAIFSGLGLSFLIKKVKYLWLQIILILSLIVYMSFVMVSYYPYYIDYYNEFMGGAKGNYEKKALQLGWWGEGGKRSADYLNNNAPIGSTIFNNMKPEHTLDNLRADLVMVKSTENPDYIVYNTLWAWGSGYEVSPEYTIVHQEKAADAPIVTVAKKIK